MSSQSKTVNKLLVAEEYPPADEDKWVQFMIDDLQKQLKKIYPDGQTLRQTHPKMHGCVKAEFIVPEDLDNNLKVGLFGKPGTYEALIRFSNASTFIQHDAKKDVRGMAIKLIDVPGSKAIDSQANENSQDFILISNESFFTPNVKKFHKLIHAFAGGKASMALFILNPVNWATVRRLAKSFVACNNVLDIPYWSNTPYMFGPGRAVKYYAAPVEASNKRNGGPTDHENYLRTNLEKTLSEGDAMFDFFVQFQTNAETMPIEDPRVKWTSPFVKVARIRIPKQVFNTEEQNLFGDGLSFSPWHSLVEHRPLGGLNRARKKVYAIMSAFWKGRNNLYTQPGNTNNEHKRHAHRRK